MDISVIIVSWNVKPYLQRCLAALQQQRNAAMEVFVVDNDSVDGSVAMVKELFPWVRLMPLQANTGFAAANNQALKIAGGRYSLILNPDTEIGVGALHALVSYMDRHADVALVAPRINNADGTFQKGSIRRDPTLGIQLLIMLKLLRLVRTTPSLKRYYRDDIDPTKEQDVEQAMGAALCIRTSVLKRAGYFDEDFFLWFEEVDLCKRLRGEHQRIRYVPDIMITHHSARSFIQQTPLQRQMIYNKSALTYFFKNHGVVPMLILALTIPLNLLLTAVYQSFFWHEKH